MRPLLLSAVTAVVAVTGCASLPLAGSQESDDPGREVRADAPADYDVLVALDHEREGRLLEAGEAYERAIEKDPESAQLHLYRADILARSGRFEEATLSAERSLALQPDAHAVRTLLARLYRLKREPDAARKVLVDEDGNPFDTASAFMLWQIYLESSRHEEALGIAEWMVEADPEDVRARVALANVYERLARPIEAEEVLRDALALDPRNVQLYGALANSKRERGDREGEIEVYREILDLHENDHGTLAALAEAQREHDLAGAIATLEHIEQLYPEDLQSTVQLALLLYEARRYRAAAERFQRVREESPGEHEIAYYYGASAAQARLEDEAMEAFLSIPPGHQVYADARTQIATLHERRGDYALALEEIERALSVAPTRDRELYSATLRARTGDFNGAVAYLEELIQANPEDDELLYNLGVVYGDGKRTRDAVRYMRRALELNPENASALNYLGYTWAESGENLDEAEEMIQRAIALRPDDGYIVDSLGWVYYMRARPLVEAGELDQAKDFIDRALAELERADELTGGDPVISEHMGDIYLLQGQRERALVKFEEAAALGIRGDEQPELLEKLETLRRELR